MPADDRIRICPDHPAYWQFKGKPMLLLGGSVEDNLFQISDLETHLDLLASVGGNYVRCTMSCRDEGNVWPFKRDGDTVDLDQWNDAFWERFSRFLQWTAERGIVVQIEVWATFDYYRDHWERNPFNPRNNRTYTADESGLPEVVDSHPVKTGNSFFWSVPAENNQQVVLKYQRKFVDRILSCSLPHGHVLYCMDNETSVTPEWGKYWSEYIKERASAVGVHVETTEMWDAHDLAHAQHANTFDHPETYSFVDVSQNNHQTGQAHWDNAQEQRERVRASTIIRPMNNVKIYGADAGRFGGDSDGVERFWRNVFGGMASARFHRPPSGQGLNETAQEHIRAAREVADTIDVFSCEPHNDLLSDREPNEAYCLANPGSQYAIWFPRGGSVGLDVSARSGAVGVKWLNISNCRWMESADRFDDDSVRLTCPTEDDWVAVVQ